MNTLSNDKRRLVGQQTAGAGCFRGATQTASANSPLAWDDDDTVELTHKGYAQIVDGMAKSIVRLECEADELRAAVALFEAEREIMAAQIRAGEGLGMALVKTINKLKEEKADLFVELVNLKAGSRRSTLGEIEESVREKYEPEYEREGIEN